MSFKAPYQIYAIAVKAIGGVVKAAAVQGCTPQNVSQLIIRKSQCPATAVKAVARASGISKAALRPDLYGD